MPTRISLKHSKSFLSIAVDRDHITHPTSTIIQAASGKIHFKSSTKIKMQAQFSHHTAN